MLCLLQQLRCVLAIAQRHVTDQCDKLGRLTLSSAGTAFSESVVCGRRLRAKRQIQAPNTTTSSAPTAARRPTHQGTPPGPLEVFPSAQHNTPVLRLLTNTQTTTAREV